MLLGRERCLLIGMRQLPGPAEQLILWVYAMTWPQDGAGASKDRTGSDVGEEVDGQGCMLVIVKTVTGFHPL